MFVKKMHFAASESELDFRSCQAQKIYFGLDGQNLSAADL